MNVMQFEQDDYLFEIHYGLIEPWGLRLSIPLVDPNKLAIETQNLKFFKAVQNCLADIPRLEAANYFDGFDHWFCQGHKIHRAIQYHSVEELEKIKKQAEIVINEINEETDAYKNAVRFLAALKEI